MTCQTLRFSTRLFLLVGLFAFLLSSCKQEEPKAKAMPANISSYVYAYTSGYISKASPIRVRLTSAPITTDKVGTEVENGILTFRSGIKGTAKWENAQTILFEPTEHLPSGTTYVGVVNLKKLYPSVPADTEVFEFDFKVKDQHLNVSVNGLRSLDVTERKEQTLVGYIKTSDIANPDLVKKVLTAKQGEKDLMIRWEHKSNNTRHEFYVEKVQRGQTASSVQLDWNGNAMGLDTKGNKVIEVPAISDFKVLSAQVVQESDQYIRVTFSDPLLQSQDFNGLIQIENYTRGYRFTVDGNQLRIYPKRRVTGERKLKIVAGIKSALDTKLKEKTDWNLSFEQIKPKVRLVGNGVILPESDGLIFPFEAVSLNFVEVEVFKIFDNNILQFLQTNELVGYGQLERVGKIIMQEKVDIKRLDPDANTNEWTRYALDLSRLKNEDPNAIYQVRIGFRPGYSTYPCSSDIEGEDDLTVVDEQNEDGEFKSIMGDYYGINGWYEGFEWGHRENPCFPAYYWSNNFIRRNVLASNLGIIAKSGKDGAYFISVADLRTTEPIASVQLDFYDYQQQLLESTHTDGDGNATVDLRKKPFVVVASYNGGKGYLRLMDPNALSLSRFDVAGAVTQKGLKGYLYGERGVWRPGDSLYLNFVLEDKAGNLPPNHPLSFELFDPRGQSQHKITTTKNVNNVYPLQCVTDPDAPTGNWRAEIKIGGAKFTKTLKIETIKPNRLKINLDFGKEELIVGDENLKGDLQVNWLHGAPAQNLKTKIEVQVKAMKTSFSTFKEYAFDDPARKFEAEPQVIFEEAVDKNGKAKVGATISTSDAAPGKLKANFKIRAFENGGDFSTDVFAMPYHPYKSYAGVYIPENKYKQRRLDIGKENKVDFAAVDTDGNPLAGRTLEVGLYRVNWRWWWDRDNDNVSRYNSSTHVDAMKKQTLKTNGKGETDWGLQIDRWGRYLVRVCDPKSGHCSGQYFYAGYPWYDNDGSGKNRNAAAMLAFSADKEKYNVGDPVELSIPTGEEGRCLISIESGTKVIETYWMDAKAGENKFSFYATEQMAPTVYANVTLIQPHGQVKNDLPIRMYGVIPINVENKETRLDPIVSMPDVLEPEQQVTVEVKEKNGKPMAYTIALVDDGLLDLTRFKTPNPWDAFYAREALGVKTWDIYDHVLGAYGGELERILSIGGDGEVRPGKGSQRANRFKPVVRNIGPFYLESGAKASHTIDIPNYVGSVRTMIVASNNGAYGRSEKTTPVRKPLMVLATLPRVLGPTETLTLPVNVFAMEEKVKDVTVTLEETSGLVEIVGDKTRNIRFDKPGEDMVSFDLKVSETVGVARFKVTAKGGGEVASQEIEIQVRNPNPYVTDVHKKDVAAGDTWSKDFELKGIKGTNTGILEVSNIPPIDLGKRLNYLIRYPHGCIEQTTSSGFPQLYVDRLMEIDSKKKEQIPENIKATIDRLKMFHLSNGGFTYWPGYDYSPWGTNYAGHFLLEARALGYTVPDYIIDTWIEFQGKTAREWTKDTRESRYYSYGSNAQLMQSYRLYTLAMAKAPELGAMNRMREMNDLSNISSWRLAAAYALAGKPEVAKTIMAKLDKNVEDYIELSHTYGSGLRDMAMILETLTLTGEIDASNDMARKVSEYLSNDRWYGTHTVAYSLLAIGKYVGDTKVGDKFQFVYQLGNGSKVTASSTKPIMQVDIPVDQLSKKSLLLENNNGKLLYARLIVSGQPLIGDKTEAANKLEMKVKYTDIKGKDIDPAKITQGTDFIAEVTIKHPNKKGRRYEEMALSQIFPSGWEIHNSRMDNVEGYTGTTKPEYQDIRDDRVHSYFDIAAGDTHTYRVQLNAAYQGRYYMPTVYCEAMYDNTINARQPGKWIEVVKGDGLYTQN